MEIDLTSVAKQALHQYTGKISRTNSCSSGEELSSEPRSFEHLLRRHVKYSDHATTLAFIESSLATTFELRQRARCTIGFFYGTLGNYDKLFTFCRSQYSAQHSSTEDAFWAATIKGAVKGGRALLPVLQTVESRGARIGPETLGICVELSQNLEESQQFISRMLSENMQVMLRGYAVFIRHVARSGDVRKAQHLLEVALRVSSATSISEKDASHLRRCFMLGLLEGAKYEELEVTHAQWCSQKLDRADAWNLVVRSRTVDRRVQQALEALREMGTRGMHVENATARELMGAVLRLRRPGRNPHVLDASDTRPYLQDIKTAISIGHKCLQLGGRTQPETWHEVMKRLSLYGEFDALEALTDWLIPQYSHVQSKMTIKRYYKYKPEQKLLSQTHAQHPLSRLIRQRDISAITTRGFVNDKPLEALNLIAKWHSMGVPVDAPAVQKRIEVGLKYLLRDLEMPQAFVEQVADKLRPVSKRLEIAHVIQNPLV
ncbi:protein of unknown function [Taphrina deformans PYCC 5710]|uniref:Pentatricopeptide repeat protein n=1 Tax=Taphrina deformans (strain PYCC 5710 / ATCC 11124 / CBS 356.35 / IMI 108563 / JCM 9778 / NBRC 8474) TaxID=1097556 RepID=R4XAL7_TAPDE|nr:protein of unknown function [Taphrina deformans PYCC 5710]|eukprot:CCG82879.1 protein of unknown function [Taphrina deformans PYCC 5710]